MKAYIHLLLENFNPRGTKMKLDKLAVLDVLNTFWVFERNGMGGVPSFDFTNEKAGISLWHIWEDKVGMMILETKEVFEINLQWNQISESYGLGAWDVPRLNALLEGEMA
jgi:hypothetical protein